MGSFVSHFLESTGNNSIFRDKMGGANSRNEPGIQEHDTDMLFIGGKSYRKNNTEDSMIYQRPKSTRILKDHQFLRPWQYEIIKGGLDNVELGEEALHLDLGPSSDLLFLNSTRGLKGSTFTFI